MAEKRKITTRKVISKAPVKEEAPIVVVSAQPRESSLRDAPRVKKVCYFCQSKTIPSYTDLANLRRYLTDRAKIVPKMRSGACSKHQRGVAKHIKYARHLSLLPFVPNV